LHTRCRPRFAAVQLTRPPPPPPFFFSLYEGLPDGAMTMDIRSESTDDLVRDGCPRSRGVLESRRACARRWCSDPSGLDSSALLSRPTPVTYWTTTCMCDPAEAGPLGRAETSQAYHTLADERRNMMACSAHRTPVRDELGGLVLLSNAQFAQMRA